MRLRGPAVVGAVISLLLATAPASATQTSGEPFPTGQPTPRDEAQAVQAGQDAIAGDNRPPGIGGPELGPVPSTAASGSALGLTYATHRVFATHYEPHQPGSVEVAVPDKCAKFAALGQSANLANAGCPGGYSLGLDYRVVVTRDSGQSATIPVKDVGPWNIDDNYWAPPGSPRPRRLFTDLPPGLPEAQAAFQDGYNSQPNCRELDGTTPTDRTAGADQFGRCVLNPAGIDLSTAAAAQLGMDNEWVTVTFLWERLEPLAIAVSSQDDPGGPRRMGVVNGCGAAYVKEGPITSPFLQQLTCGDTRQLTLGGNRVGVINSCGAAYVKEESLTAPFIRQLGCGDARLVVLSSGFRLGVINGCGGSWVKVGALSNPFVQQTGCGDARSLDVSTRRVAVINGCGALWVKEPGTTSPFLQQTLCGTATATGVSANRLGYVDACGAFHVKEGSLSNAFQQQTGCYDTRAIALTDSRIGVVNGCRAVYVKEGSVTSPFRRLLNCGDGQAVHLSGDRVAVINGCRSAWVKEGSLDAPFRQQLSCGDARFVTLSG